MKLISILLIISVTLASGKLQASAVETNDSENGTTSYINEEDNPSLIQWYIHINQFLFAGLLALAALVLIYALICRVRLNTILQKNANELIRSLFTFYFKYIYLFLSVVILVSTLSLIYFLLNDFNYNSAETQYRLTNHSNDSLLIYKPFESYLLIPKKQEYLFNISLFRLPDWLVRFTFNFIEYPFLILLNLLLVQLLMLKKVRLYLIDKYLKRSVHQRKKHLKNKFRNDMRCDFNKLMKIYRKIFHFFARIYLFNYSTLFGTIVTLVCSFLAIFSYTFDWRTITTSVQINANTLNMILNSIFKALIIYLSLIALIRIVRIKLKSKKRPKLTYMSPYDEEHDSDHEATNDMDNDLIELHSTSGSVANLAETPSVNTTLVKTAYGGSNSGVGKKRDNTDQMSKFNAINDDEFIKTNKLMKQILHANLAYVLIAVVLMLIYCALSFTAIIIYYNLMKENLSLSFVDYVVRRKSADDSQQIINFLAIINITCLCIKFMFYVCVIFFSCSFLYQLKRSIFSTGPKKIQQKQLKNGGSSNKNSLRRHQFNENEHLTRNYRSLSKSNSKNLFFNTMSAHSSHTLDSNEPSKDSDAKYNTQFMNMFYGFSDSRVSKQPVESGVETQASSEMGERVNLIQPKSDHKRTSSKTINYFENLQDSVHLGNLNTDLFSFNHMNANVSHYDAPASISNGSNLNNTNSFSTFKRSPHPAGSLNSTMNKISDLSGSHSHMETSANEHEMKPISKSTIQEDPAYSSTQLFQVKSKE